MVLVTGNKDDSLNSGRLHVDWFKTATALPL